MSVHRRFPETDPLISKEQVRALLEEMERTTKLASLTEHEGWKVLDEDLTKREYAAMQQLTYGSLNTEDVAFNRALAQICRYIRELPSRSTQQRETLQAEYDLYAPRNGG
jgi:hypothetical protein